MVIYIYHFLLFKKPKENDIKYKYQDFYASAKGQVSVRRRPFGSLPKDGSLNAVRRGDGILWTVTSGEWGRARIPPPTAHSTSPPGGSWNF